MEAEQSGASTDEAVADVEAAPSEASEDDGESGEAATEGVAVSDGSSQQGQTPSARKRRRRRGRRRPAEAAVAGEGPSEDATSASEDVDAGEPEDSSG